jgi:hypothetical protein
MKFSYFALACLFASFGAVAKAACDVGNPVLGNGILYAGQDIAVGEVDVELCDEKVTITYSLYDDTNPGLCLTAVHAEVFQLDTSHYDAITTKNGNPRNGQFIINEVLDASPCQRVYEETIANEDFTARVDFDDCQLDVNVAAHAVVSMGYFGAYGYARKNDAAPEKGLYALDFDAEPTAATLLLARDDMRGSLLSPAPADNAFPNGLAFDPVTGRLFYVIDYRPNSLAELWAYNVFEGGKPELISDELPGRITGTCGILTTK